MTEIPRISAPEYPRLRWAVACFVFFGVPLLLAGMALQQIWHEAEQQRTARQVQQLEQLLSGLEKWREPTNFLKVVLAEANQQVFGSANPQQTFAAVRRHLQHRFPGVFEFVFLDGTGRVVPEVSDGRPPRRILLKLWQTVTQYYVNRSYYKDLLTRDFPMFRAYLGSTISPRASFPSGFSLASYKERRHQVYLSPTHRHGMFIAHMNRVPQWSIIGLHDQVARINAQSSPFRVGLYDVRWPLASVAAEIGPRGGDLGKVVKAFESSPHGHLFINGHWWAQRIIRASTRLFAVYDHRHPAAAQPQFLKYIVFASLPLLFFTLSWLAWQVMSGRWALYLSIRAKLLALFAYTAGLPLAVMGITGHSYLGERRAVLENQVFRSTEEALLQFDKNMPGSLGEIEAAIDAVMGQQAPAHRPIMDVAKERMQRVTDRFAPSMCELIGEDGERRWRAVVTPNDFNVPLKMLKNVVVNIMRSLNTQEEPDMEDVSGSALFSGLATVSGMDPQGMFSDLARQLRQFAEFRFGPRSSVACLYPVLDARNRAPFLAMFAWRRELLERRYVKRSLKPMCKQLTDTEVFAYNDEYREHSWPAEFSYARLVVPIQARLKLRNQTVKERIVRGGTVYLVTGVRGVELSEYHLIAVTRDDLIRAELTRIRWSLGSMALGMLAIALSVGATLARSFLGPVGNLSLGVAALRSRQFDRRVPVLDRDELGDLAATFNEMMEGLADLEVARIVQESLFPNTALTAPGATVFGSCLPAAQVGGDYYDYFTLPGDRLAIIIGDVSGHGVGAAMVMAMAKALFALEVAAETDPAQLLGRINNVFLATIKRKKMMTCFFALCELRTGRMFVSNAGHNPPLLVRGTTVTMLELNQAPLGIRARPNYKNAEFMLEPGDTVLFYTDGLVEAVGHDGTQLGTTELMARLPAMLGPDPQATEGALRAWHNRVVRPGPQDDDISLVVLQLAQERPPTPASPP